MINKDLLINSIEEIGLNCDDILVNRFENYQDVLLEWNKNINLTRIVEENEIIQKHFIDSLSCLSLDIIKPESKIIDIGTGAGFPGVPIKMYYNDVDLTLLDSLNKKIKYLMELCHELELDDVKFLHSRTEDAAKDPQHRQQYDVAIARAVAELNVLAEYCLPYVKVGGYFIAQKGPKINDEIERGENAIKYLGGEIVSVNEIKIPFSELKHNIVVIKKVEDTPDKYPRKAGKPTKSPLK